MSRTRMRNATLQQHLDPAPPKRILALDGGGVRGILTLGYLEHIEDLLRARYGNDPNFRLCEYFDLIGGTSTGAILASGLALGKSVAELKTLYRDLAAKTFKRPFTRRGIFAAKFPSAPLQKALDDTFHSVKLGDPEVRTGLSIISKRYDTGSPWVIHNHPNSRYFDPKPPSKAFPNKLFKLAQIVRASTAAPHYFEPEYIQVADSMGGAFVDGGMSPHNNPALQLLMLVTLKGYAWKWATGADNLLLVSLGTGYADFSASADDALGMAAGEMAFRSLLSLMNDCSWHVQIMLQWMSRSPTKSHIDREIGDLKGDTLGGQELLTYLRYNVQFDAKWISDMLKMKMDEDELAGLAAMDDPGNLDQLADLGAKAAAMQIRPEHFSDGFDIVKA